MSSMLIYFREDYLSFNPAIQHYNYQMEAIVKENELLKGYIASLEKENQARNVERATLFNEIDRMEAEINRLNALLSNSSSSRVTVTNTTMTSNNEREVIQLKESNAALRIEVQTLKTLNAQLAKDQNNKSTEILFLKQDQQLLNTELQTLKSSQSQITASSNRVLILESQISTYKTKLTQLASLEQSLKTSSSKVTELQTANRKLESDVRRVEAQVKRLESENRELKLSSKSSLDASSLLNSKLSLQATVRQLNGKLEWLQGSNKSAEQERQTLEKRIRELEKELLEARGKAAQLRYNEESLKALEASLAIKDKEMEALEQMINSLKDNKKYLERVLREKEEAIVTLDAHNYQFQNERNEISNLKTQVTNLFESKTKIEKEFSSLLQIHQALQLQWSQITQKEQNYLTEITSLRTQRERLLRQLDMSAQSYEQVQRELRLARGRSTDLSAAQRQPFFRMPEREIKTDNEDDIRMVVSTLKSEIDALKATQSRPAPSNHPTHCESCSQLNLRSHFSRQSRSPARGHIKLPNNQREKSPMKKQKWDTLQRKINALRSQNESLKRSLFD